MSRVRLSYDFFVLIPRSYLEGAWGDYMILCGQTDTQTDVDERYTPATLVGVSKYKLSGTKARFPLAELTGRVDGYWKLGLMGINA